MITKATELNANIHWQTALIFAARYAHNRRTGAALAVIVGIKHNWHVLELSARQFLWRESFEAVYNLADWKDLRDWIEVNETPDELARIKNERK